jgi:CRISPR-associated protein Csy2
MSAVPESSGVVIVPRLRIQNANAISSPSTHGFPSITAFAGLMWNLQRRLPADLRGQLHFDGVGVICHGFDEQVYDASYVKQFRQPRNPVDKDGSTAAIVEEGRIHLDVTLVFGVRGSVINAEDDERDVVARRVADTLAQLRVAGGSVLPSIDASYWARPRMTPIPEASAERGRWFRQLRRRWLPGYALVGRDDLLASTTERLCATQPTANALDAWLALSSLSIKPFHETEETGEKAKVEWRAEKHKGWTVPIPVGYGVLASHAPGEVANARDPQVPFRFVESLYSIGEWIGAHRLETWRDVLWYPEHDEERGLYRVRSAYVVPELESESDN